MTCSKSVLCGLPEDHAGNCQMLRAGDVPVAYPVDFDRGVILPRVDAFLSDEDLTVAAEKIRQSAPWSKLPKLAECFQHLPSQDRYWHELVALTLLSLEINGDVLNARNAVKTMPGLRKYRKQSAIVEAMLFDGTLAGALRVLALLDIPDAKFQPELGDLVSGQLLIPSSIGGHSLSARGGDFIVRIPTGQIFPVEKSIFASTYGLVSEPT